MIFCDTSTAVKIYALERESGAVQLHFDTEDEICLSELARVEIMGVFHRRLRENGWNQAQFSSAVRQFDEDDASGVWTWLPLDQSILQAAANVFAKLPSSIFLRASDCIHLVTANNHHFREIYTYDKHQLQAASVLGLKPISIT